MRIKNKGIIKTLFIMTAHLAAAVRVYAADDLVPPGLMTMAESIMDVFTGDLAKIILGCCFAGACIAYAYNKDNEKMKGKVLAVVVATGLLIITQQIMDRLWAAA
jgi:type IV secretory pathway VirB2 component (pilin)